MPDETILAVLVDQDNSRAGAAVVDRLTFNRVRACIEEDEDIVDRGVLRHQELFAFDAHVVIVAAVTKRTGDLDVMIVRFSNAARVVDVEEPGVVLSVGHDVVTRVTELPIHMTLNIALQVIVRLNLFALDRGEHYRG